MALRKPLAPHRSPPPATKARARQSRTGLPRKVAGRAQGDRCCDVGKSWAHVRRELSHQNADGERPHRLRAGGGFRRRGARREAFHRLRTSFGELGDPGAWRPAARRFPHRRLPAFIQPPYRNPAAQHSRAPLQGGSDAQELPWPRASSCAPSRTAPVRASSPTSGTTTDRLCLSSDSPRGRLSFPRSSLAGRVCRFMPAPRSAVRADVSASASCPSQCRRQTTSAADALVATQMLQLQYEAFIREAPEQWMWAHRKWG